MKENNIKPIPKYIIKLIQKEDKIYGNFRQGRTRFYSYLTKNDGELVKVTVAVKNRYGKLYCKQVAVHGIHSKICFIKDIVFYMISGYQVGWYEQGLQDYSKWYETKEWGWQEDKNFDPFAPIVNREYLNRFSEYKYSAIDLYKGFEVLKYLRTYEQYPQIEYLMKAGLDGYIFSKQILQKVAKEKAFCKWLMKNREKLRSPAYYVEVVLKAYKTGKSIDYLQFTESTMLPKLEEQLKAKNQEIENIVNAVQKGFATQTLLQRLGELEKERDEIGEAIAKEKIKTPIFSQDHFRMALHNFRKIDVSKQDGKRKIIDTFINAIYVSDDDFKIVYNVNGKEETIKLEELESSTLFSNGAPKYLGRTSPA